MKIFTWSAALVLVLVTIVFAVNNYTPTELDFFPLPYKITLPLYGLVLLGLLFGFMIGASASWLASGKWRRLARVRKREIDNLTGEVVQLKKPEAIPAIEADKPAPAEPKK
ncbi:MAG: lipopolysaccharide assembly protein LapA domain-containing protein [Alphaproteobacteria bacterium]